MPSTHAAALDLLAPTRIGDVGAHIFGGRCRVRRRRDIDDPDPMTRLQKQGHARTPPINPLPPTTANPHDQTVPLNSRLSIRETTNYTPEMAFAGRAFLPCERASA